MQRLNYGNSKNNLALPRAGKLSSQEVKGCESVVINPTLPFPPIQRTVLARLTSLLKPSDHWPTDPPKLACRGHCLPPTELMLFLLTKLTLLNSPAEGHCPPTELMWVEFVWPIKIRGLIPRRINASGSNIYTYIHCSLFDCWERQGDRSMYVNTSIDHNHHHHHLRSWRYLTCSCLTTTTFFWSECCELLLADGHSRNGL